MTEKINSHSDRRHKCIQRCWSE